MPNAWTCPVCGRGVAPHIPTCEHGGTLGAIPVQPVPPTESPMPPPTTAGEPDWRKIFEEQMNRMHNGDPKHPWWNPNPLIVRTLEMKPGDWSHLNNGPSPLRTTGYMQPAMGLGPGLGYQRNGAH